MTPGGGRLPGICAGAAAVLGLLGAALLLSIGIAERAVDARQGQTAARFRGSNAQALGFAAQDAARFGQSDKAARLARKALQASPINVHAARVLAQSMSDTPSGAADRLMLAAAKLGWRDPLTQVWMLQRAIGARAPLVAVRRAEALVRLDKQRDIAALLLRLLAMDPTARGTMVAALATDPVWREVFLTLQEKIPPAQLPGLVSILTDLRGTAAPPRAAEARPTIEALLEANQVDQAFRLHRLLFERGRAPLVSNPGFERQDVGYEASSSASPFDWKFLNPGRSSAAIYASPAGRVLAASAAGNIEGRIAEQLLVLRPGAYELSYKVQSPEPSATERVRWSIRCPEGVPVVFAAPPIRLTPDRPVARRHAFSVGGECPSQVLELRAEPRPGAAPIDVEFDNVQVRRLG